ncbi:MAG: 4Fe-4S dicluster domain-containing protein [Acidimicrobiia bacterium]|nr:4Fe-4S dicluster domain-containing protein [Acidimicrobiia bacterium]
MNRFMIDLDGLDALIRALEQAGFQVVGPVWERGAVRLRPIRSAADLPQGISDEQAPGRYRASAAGDLLFGYAVGPSSLKEALFPPRRTLWEATLSDGGWRFEAVPADQRPLAVIGARPCDVAAVAVQDRVLLDGSYVDPDYARRRDSLFVVAVNCTVPAATCFCASMGTGPDATGGPGRFDLALTELRDGSGHRFIGTVGSDAGADFLENIPTVVAADDDVAAVDHLLEAAGQQARRLDTDGLSGWIVDHPEHPRWDAIAERCLACGNCTAVCPTCFCVSTEPSMSLDGSVASMDRRWDSCYSLDFTFMGGRPVRSSVKSRYRQWLTHKVGTWQEQFGQLGCVGCGRCITWCPAGIDLTAEIAAMRETSDA